MSNGNRRELNAKRHAFLQGWQHYREGKPRSKHRRTKEHKRIYLLGYKLQKEKTFPSFHTDVLE